MARKKWVSRTIIGTEVTFLCVNTKEQKVVEETITFGGEFKDDKAIMKAAAKADAFKGDIKPATIKSSRKVEKLYAITEETFLANAVECDPITRKPLGATDDDEVSETVAEEN